MADGTNEIDRIQVDLIRALASPVRLSILHLLGRGPLEVGHIATELGLAPALVSQNLAAMRGVGLVTPHRDGRTIRYRLTDPEIIAACDLMRQVIVRRVQTLATLAADPVSQSPAIAPAKRQVVTA